MMNESPAPRHDGGGRCARLLRGKHCRRNSGSWRKCSRCSRRHRVHARRYLSRSRQPRRRGLCERCTSMASLISSTFADRQQPVRRRICTGMRVRQRHSGCKHYRGGCGDGSRHSGRTMGASQALREAAVANSTLVARRDTRTVGSPCMHSFPKCVDARAAKLDGRTNFLAIFREHQKRRCVPATGIGSDPRANRNRGAAGLLSRANRGSFAWPKWRATMDTLPTPTSRSIGQRAWRRPLRGEWGRRPR